MIVCWSTIAGLRLAVFTGVTSGTPVMVAQTPRAVPNVGVKQFSKNTPLRQSSAK